MAKCLKCHKIELTEAELKTKKQMCMFCLIDLNILMKKSLGVAPPPIIPEVFGRTKEEYDKYVIAGSTTYMEQESEESIGTEKTSPPKEDLLKKASENTLKMDAKEEMEMSALLNEFKEDAPPITLDVMASEDFILSYTFPGNTPDRVKEAVFKEMKKFYVETARFILMSDKYGQYVKDPNEPNQPPMLNIGG